MLQNAWKYINEFGIEDTDVVYASENGADYAEDHYYFDFTPTAENGMTKVYGDVLLELGKDGRLLSISDNRIWCEYVENVQCISMADSIAVAREVGCGNWQGKAVVESIEESYAFISETGYLIPIWMINGYLDGGSQPLVWHSRLDAIK